MRSNNNKRLKNIVLSLKKLLKQYGATISYIYKEKQGDPEPGPSIEEIGLNEYLTNALRSYGILRLHLFQYEAYRLYMEGKSQVIVAGTGTGKTEAFIIPILDDIIKRGPSVEKPYAIIMYPTKALARDQLYRFKLLAEGKLGIKVAVLDGDTPRDERTKIYADPPHILVTNPDMMHYGLAFSDRIRRLVSGVKVLVLDEMHVYRGVFGTHVKWVIERLKHYADDNMLIIGAGATIGNPRELGEKLFGENPQVVRGPSRRKGTAYHVFVSYGTTSRWTIASFILSFLVKNGLKTLCFVDSQQMSELIARIARRSYSANVAVHRAGLDPSYRKKVEDDFREGRINGLVATPTMELGIDLGDLDAIIMATLPRSISSYLQRAGRAGRRDNPGIIFTILGDDPIEQYFLRKPQEFFKQEPDPSYIEPDNMEIARIHGAAILLERGLVEASRLPTPIRRALDELSTIGYAKKIGDRYYPDWQRVREIVKGSGLRSAGPQVSIVEDGQKKIGSRELPQALYDLYPGAIYYHAGRSYLVTSLELDKYTAVVKRVGADVRFYTKPLYTVDVASITPLERRRLSSITLTYAEVDLLITVTGYVIREEYTGRKLGEVFYDDPITWRMRTKALVTQYPNPGIKDAIRLISGYHALEHALISASKPVVGASDTDLGGISYPSGHIIIYDSTPGGNGASRLIYERLEKVHDIAENILASCDCDNGCPKCVYSPYCGNNNQFLSRREAYKILQAVYKLPVARPVKDKGIEGKPLV
ncbi:MAG: DEAD/DEAH box helicase [Desulfurococcales archaeon]|nr:DEAD/DEAH box helicase [Desulfurococcales archaeon]